MGKSNKKGKYIRWFEELSSEDGALVGGKNASLGEMLSKLKAAGIKVPGGFATTADAYWEFLAVNELTEKIEEQLEGLSAEKIKLEKAGKTIRGLFLDAEFPEAIAEDIRSAYRELGDRDEEEQVTVAVRSSATAEDLPEASFAGQLETFLNIKGEEELLDACRKCLASLFTDRAINYRTEQGFEHMKVALSVGIQKMVRSDKAGSGVMFSIDTETGFKDAVVIDANWGLGETVVQGTVTPDEYLVFKPLLDDESLCPIIEKTLGEKETKMVFAKGGSKTTKTVKTSREDRRSFVLDDKEILQLARWAKRIEAHYERPMDMEWAKDGLSGELFIVQARPETVQSTKKSGTLKSYHLQEKGERILTGLSIGQAIATGQVCRLKSADEIDQFVEGAILVTEMTDPDWGPILKQAAGIITEHGGRTCHAAIVSRELGVPAIVGAEKATDVLQDGQEITLSCAEGDQGYVYDGILEYEEKNVDLQDIPETETQIMMNIASPAAAFQWWQLPCRGIGLARMEFIINNIIRVHPLALLRYDELEDKAAKKEIQRLTQGYASKADYFIDRLALGVARIAASQYPDPVIVRMSDFKTNEYADLIGGRQFEPEESNPMLGFRGASRYYAEAYKEGFGLECRAIKKAREEIGLSNVIAMIPFCRTPAEADKVLEVMAENGLIRGKNGLEVYVMAEIPANITLADQFAQRFDAFSIGSNDLTQLILGVDRDSAQLAYLFDEQNEAVKIEISRLIKTAHRAGTKVGICGQAPSDSPEFARFLVEEGIDSISLNPDSVVEVIRNVAAVEKERNRK